MVWTSHRLEIVSSQLSILILAGEVVVDARLKAKWRRLCLITCTQLHFNIPL
jgi:hypothetical protein